MYGILCSGPLLNLEGLAPEPNGLAVRAFIADAYLTPAVFDGLDITVFAIEIIP